MPAWFVRLSGCNLSCSWCDTPYTWDWKGQNGVAYDRGSETQEMGVEEVWEALSKNETGLVVVTGGEPLIQQTEVVLLSQMIPDARVEIETNGTRPPSSSHRSDTRFNVSPKLDNAGCLGSWRPNILREFPPDRTVLKFVVVEPSDLDEIEEKLSSDHLDFPVWVMPEGTDRDTILSRLEGWLFDGASARGWNVTSRLHVLTFGDRRDV
jgi:organic radical activating enzyme